MRADSGSAWTGSYGARRWPRGRKCGKVRRAVGGWWTGNGAFAVSGRSWEVEFALPRRGRVRDDSGRRLGGVGGFGPNLSIVVSSAPALSSVNVSEKCRTAC